MSFRNVLAQFALANLRSLFPSPMALDVLVSGAGNGILTSSIRRASTASRGVKTRRSKYATGKGKKGPKSPIPPRKQGTIKANLDLLIRYFSSVLVGVYTEEQVRNFFDLTVQAHNKLVDSTGVVQGTKTWKAVCLQAVLVLEGRAPSQPSVRMALGKVDKWPKVLTHLRPLAHIITGRDTQTTSDDVVKGNIMQLFHTLFKLNKVCLDFVKIDTNDLSRKFKIDGSIEQRFIKHLELRSKPADLSLIDLNAEPFFSPKAGPNSLPKLDSVDMEAYALVNSRLWKPFCDYCIITDNTDIMEYILLREECFKDENASDLPEPDTIRLRKIIAIPDRGNKSRNVAICDFFTQCLLSSLERDVIQFTNERFANHTAFSNHSKGFDTIKSLPMETLLELQSIDATSWTDNLPARLQFLMLKHRYGLDLATAWLGLAVHCDWNIGNTDYTVRYGRGQGMGTKASFAIAQLTNMEFIDMILIENYGDDQGNHSQFYLTVGDDMVIQDPKQSLAGEFESIGVPVNLSKSKFATNGMAYVEFVSRNLWNNTDVSPISASLAAKARRQPFYLPTFHKHIQERSNSEVSLVDVVNLTTLPQKQKDTVLLLNDIFELALSPSGQIIPSESSRRQNVDLLAFADRLLLNVGADFMKFVQSNDFRKVQINSAKQANEVDRLGSLDDSTIWQAAVRSNFTPKQLELIILSRRFFKISIETRIEGEKFDVSQIVNPIRNLPMDLQSVSKLIMLSLRLEKSRLAATMRLNTISTKVEGDVQSHKSNVELFKQLNRALDPYPDIQTIELGKKGLAFLNLLDLYEEFSLGRISKESTLTFNMFRTEASSNDNATVEHETNSTP